MPKVGDIVRITYDGQLMESYPAQIGNVFRIQVVTGEYQTESYLYHVDENGKLSDLHDSDDYVTYALNYANMAVHRLEGWEYETEQWRLNETGNSHYCGIRFRPEGEEGWVALYFHEYLSVAVSKYELFSQVIRSENWGNYEMNVSYEENSGRWLYARYAFFNEERKYIPGTYIAWNEGADNWMVNADYYEQLMFILKSVRLAEGILREDEALAIARTVSEETENMNYFVRFETHTGEGIYCIDFSDETGECLWKVRVDNNGNIRKVNGQDFSRTYQYEKEGFGGDFIIKLSGDGVAMYYEGGLSSYIGLGTWVQEENIVTVTVERKSYRFRLEENALVFIEEGSAHFTYSQVADGERFYLQEG
jgi:hypothetical protein